MNLDDPLQNLFSLAIAEATEAHAEALAPIHLFIAACKVPSPEVQAVLQAEDLDPKALRRQARQADPVDPHGPASPARVSSRVRRILDRARALVEKHGRATDATAVLCALLAQPDRQLGDFLDRQKVPLDRLRAALEDALAGRRPAPSAPSTTPVLDQYGRDYTALARAGQLGPVIGRRDEIKELLRTLYRKEKCNPVLVGEAGVGKTCIVEGLALHAAGPDAAPEVRRLRVVEVLLPSLVAGAKYRGEMEERVQKLIEEASSRPDLVLFLDEIHLMVGTGSGGGAMDLANILKPALARGAMRVIGATTPAEYEQHIRKDAALERRFQPVTVDEPTPAEAREMLAGLRPAYEAHHHVQIDDGALDAAIELSVRYLPDRRLPDKARDLVDQAAVDRRFTTLSPGAPREAGHITRDDVARVLARWTRIPVERLGAGEAARLAGLEDVLRRRVIGQDAAVGVVARAVRASVAGLSRPGRPRTVLLFVGPTGVGKTELARALAEQLFGSEQDLVRLDMSEYMEEHSVSRLIGSPPGYVGHDEGGQLTDAVRRKPYCVLLLDEVEKAHPRIMDVFLQVFEEGRLTDARGRRADFSNVYILLTSNLGHGEARAARAPIGIRPDGAPAPGDDGLQDALRRHFRPELLNRMGEVVRFRALDRDDLRAILDKVLRGVEARLASSRLQLRLGEGAAEVLVAAGDRPGCGARELERVVDRMVVQPLSDARLAGRFGDGATVWLQARGDGIELVDARPEAADGR